MNSSLPLSLAPLALTAPVFAQTAAPPSQLPIKQITVFTSGVSYIERDGTVSGDAVVPLTFRTAQINDLLKSLTLIDTHGQVQPVVYGARDPISRTLQSFAIDVTAPHSRAELLNQLRGSSVSVTLTSKAVETGQIVSVESKSVTGPNNSSSTVDTLNLLAADGLRSVRLDDAVAIKLLDGRLDQEFRSALTTLASGADNQRRTVTLHFTGSGRRPVSVGYITESPLWKISYRLLLGDAGKAAFQGWALVENTSDEDWSDIHLSLVSGRPVSFIQDLYQPLYLPRPIVQPDIIASPTPQTHDGSMDASDSGVMNAPPPPAAPAAVGGFGASPARGRQDQLPDGVTKIFALQSNNSLLAYGQNNIIAQAKGVDAGEQFAYNITTPVTLPRQQAAMIPVVSQDIGADKVSLYNANTDPRFPLNAIRLKNATKLHLKGGPVTLFDGGTYAGDAIMEDVAPGESRLISYAVDLSVVGERQFLYTDQPHRTLTIHAGVLTITRRDRSKVKYVFKSKALTNKTLLVEHPFDAECKLITPATATERTPNLYRFAVPLPAGKTATLIVETETPTSYTVALLDGNLDTFISTDGSQDIPAATRTALTDIVTQRRHIQNLANQAASDDAQIAEISSQQDRLRKNMAALDRASSLYKHYVSELETQETQITNLRTDAQRQRSAAEFARKTLRNTLDNLVI